MATAYPIPRNAMIWLLVAMFAGILPHMLRLPLWVTLVCLLCGLWRVMVYRERWRLPGRLIKTVLVFSGAAAVWGDYGTLAGPEAGSALLLLGFCFKLLETHNRRDVFIVVVLGYFVVATSFFFQQEIVNALYLLLVCFLITAALLGLNQSPLQTAPRRTARQALRLMLHALPLMLVLFVLVPRIGPIWALDLSSPGSRTGLSEEISPGDIAALSRSPELAFRVEFEGPVPPQEQLYWRALVMDQFDGRTWRRNAEPSMEEWVAWYGQRVPWNASMRSLGGALSYRVIMEPSDQRWLFALDLAQPRQAGVGITRDFRLISRNPVSQPFSYRVRSSLAHRIDPQLPRWLELRNLQLPEGGNPRSRELARSLAAVASSGADYVDRAMRLFAEQPFSYTLKPPLLNGDRVDQFLFDSQRGFCSHYASALVFLLRSAGIPARIVAGYQGGEYNALGGYLLVHQFDAHAWAEAWLPERGWVRLDPTAMVAPERVEQGLEQAVSEAAEFLADSPFSALRYRNLAWLSQLRLTWDYVNFAWHRSVLGFDADRQQRWFASWFGRVDWRLMGGLLLLAIALVLGALAIWLLLVGRGTDEPPMVREYRRFCARMARRGYPLRGGESPGQYLCRLGTLLPDQRRFLEQMAALIERALYDRKEEAGAARRLRRISRMIKG